MVQVGVVEERVEPAAHRVDPATHDYHAHVIAASASGQRRPRAP